MRDNDLIASILYRSFGYILNSLPLCIDILSLLLEYMIRCLLIYKLNFSDLVELCIGMYPIALYAVNTNLYSR